MANSKDLFDDQTMTFGEHLDTLRTHLIKALFGLIICVLGALIYGTEIVAIVRSPIDAALVRHGLGDNLSEDMKTGTLTDVWNYVTGSGADRKKLDTIEPKKGVKGAKGKKDATDKKGTQAPKSTTDGKPAAKTEDGKKEDGKKDEKSLSKEEKEAAEKRALQTIRVEVSPSDLANALHAHDKKFPRAEPNEDEKPIHLEITAPEFSQLKNVVKRQNQAVTLTVQEAFLTFLKVAFVAGLAIASPWVFFQIWLFVAAGLYPHERHYVYIYLPMSILLFGMGAVFCFLGVFPFVLDFLLGFNKMLDVEPQIRLSEWISFAIMLPMMFGLSFQLPLVMLFLERISVFEVSDYREKRRMAVLVIAFLSMMLTPADPMSMLMMMGPLIILYEFGIILCAMKPSKAGFPDEPQVA